jgi:hypothetical protein
MRTNTHPRVKRAGSVASVLLLTEATMTEIPEKRALAAPAHDMME